MSPAKITEAQGRYRHLEKMAVPELLAAMNKEDMGVPAAVGRALDQIEKLTVAATAAMRSGGRLFYLGAGTSGRLGVLDASEIPPTFGSRGLVIAVIAGGARALRFPVENAEDDTRRGWLDLVAKKVNKKDIVVGIASSGTTPYVTGALKECRKRKIATGCITCNENTPLAALSDYPVEVIVGPEFVTGSTRMKSGTAQKLVLNMLSTAVMIQLGKVEDSEMINMQLTNSKLIDRGTKMLMKQTGISDYEKAKSLLLKYGSVKKAKENNQI
jgi:N-acetylmuramic acid 6-phosphate etherase